MVKRVAGGTLTITETTKTLVAEWYDQQYLAKFLGMLELQEPSVILNTNLLIVQEAVKTLQTRQLHQGHLPIIPSHQPLSSEGAITCDSPRTNK